MHILSGVAAKMVSAGMEQNTNVQAEGRSITHRRPPQAAQKDVVGLQFDP